MGTVTNKRKVQSVEENVNALREIENGKQNADVWREFGLVISENQTSWKKLKKIINVFKQNGEEIKLFRKPVRSDLDEALLMWFKHQTSDNVPVSCLLLTLIFVSFKF